MKRTVLLCSLLFSATVAAQAQNNIIKLNAASLLVQTASVFYEHRLNTGHSLNLGLFVTNYTDESSGFIPHKTEFGGYGLTAEYRIYTGDEALRGFFIGPYLRFQDYNFSETSFYTNSPVVMDKATLTTFGGGLVLGIQGIVKNRVGIEPFLGVGYAAGEVDNLNDNHGTFTVNNGIRGVEVRLGLSIGFAFGGEPDTD